MLYEEIRLNCKAYHGEGTSYDGAYRRYLAQKQTAKWDIPETLDFEEVRRVVDFANQWKSRMPSSNENVERILVELRYVVPKLNLLRSDTLLDLDFSRDTPYGTVSELIARSFDRIAGATRRSDGAEVYASVGTSKILNAALNPNLFVMWDGAIQTGYGVFRDGYAYANIFLPKMQEIAHQAVDEVMRVEGLSYNDAIKSFTDRCRHKNSLAKIIDESNYVRLTLG